MGAEREVESSFLKGILKLTLLTTPIGVIAISAIVDASSQGPSQDNFNFLIGYSQETSADIYVIDTDRGLLLNITGEDYPNGFIFSLTNSNELLLMRYSSEENLEVINVNSMSERVKQILSGEE